MVELRNNTSEDNSQKVHKNTKPVRLSELVGEMELQFDGMYSFLDLVTGNIVSVSDEELRAAQGEHLLDDYPYWQHELIDLARDIEDDVGRYIALPTRFDIHEYSIMENFCLSLEDDRLSKEMYSAIKGHGAFRRFKDSIRQHGIEDEWYSFKSNALREIAVAWCERNGIRCIN